MGKSSVKSSLESLPGLSEEARTYVRDHPADAGAAASDALEEAAAAAKRYPLTEPDEIPENLKPFVIDEPEPGMLGVPAAAARLGVSQATVYDWLGKNMLIGWRSARRGVQIPAEQIMGPGNVVPGINRLLGTIHDPELAWVFLSLMWPFENEYVRPIDKLKKGDIDDVIGAAPGFGSSVT